MDFPPRHQWGHRWGLSRRFCSLSADDRWQRGQRIMKKARVANSRTLCLFVCLPVWLTDWSTDKRSDSNSCLWMSLPGDVPGACGVEGPLDGCCYRSEWGHRFYKYFMIVLQGFCVIAIWLRVLLQPLKCRFQIFLSVQILLITQHAMLCKWC